MLDGVNDSDDACATSWSALVREVPCKFNLIPFNPFPGTGFRARSPRAHPRASRDPDATPASSRLRKTRGDDIAAACGQLAGEVAGPHKRRLAHAHRAGWPRKLTPVRLRRMRARRLPASSSPAAVGVRAADAGRRRRIACRSRRRCRKLRPRIGAQLHAELAAGLLRARQMGVALEELAAA